MMPFSHEYEVVWTGEMERQAIAAQQIDARTLPPRNRRDVGLTQTSERVLKYLAGYPGVTAGHVAIALGMDPSTVRHALAALAVSGFVAPSHRVSDNPRLHIRWKVI